MILQPSPSNNANPSPNHNNSPVDNHTPNAFPHTQSLPGIISVNASDTLFKASQILRNHSSLVHPSPSSSGISRPSSTTSSATNISSEINSSAANTTNSNNPNANNANVNNSNNNDIKRNDTDANNNNNNDLSSAQPQSPSPIHPQQQPSPQSIQTIIPTSAITRNIYRLAILSDRTVLCTLDYGRMLKYVYTKLAPSNKLLFSLTLSQLNLPSSNSQLSFHIVNESHKVLEVLEILRMKNLRAVPIISATTGKLTNVFSISDTALLLGADWGQSIIHTSIGSLMNRVRGNRFSVFTCKITDCLADVFKKFEMSRKHRLFIVDDRDIVVGVLTLDELLRYFLEGY